MRSENGKGCGQIARLETNSTEPLELSKEFRIYSEYNGNCLDGCKLDLGMI